MVGRGGHAGRSMLGAPHSAFRIPRSALNWSAARLNQAEFCLTPRAGGADPAYHLVFPANNFLAAATRVSGSKPNFFCNSFKGAEAPNVFMPMIVPALPA